MSILKRACGAIPLYNPFAAVGSSTARMLGKIEDPIPERPVVCFKPSRQYMALLVKHA